VTRSELLAQVRAALSAAGVDEAGAEARWLVEAVLGLSTTELHTRPAGPVAEAERLRAEAWTQRRAGGETLGRILGERSFAGLRMQLGPQTLEPRPDTEAVVEAALACLGDAGRACTLLDLGTGTGAILIALLKALPASRGAAVDLSEGAARVAAGNAALNGVADRMSVIVGDWSSSLSGPFDLVVSNPPYIESAAVDTLDREVRDHDPRLALDGGPDGLGAYRAILADAGRVLRPGGHVVLELGIGQADAVTAIAAGHGLRRKALHRDGGGVERALVLTATAG